VNKWRRARQCGHWKAIIVVGSEEKKRTSWEKKGKKGFKIVRIIPYDRGSLQI